MQLANHNLHIEIHGPAAGPPIILLHHGLGSTRSWRKQVPALTTAGYRVFVYDRWGYGQSAARPGLDIPGFEDDLADLAAIVATYQLHKPILIGHSDGGTIGLYWAARQPQQISALVTVAAHIYLEPKMEPGIQQIAQAFEQDSRFRAGLRRVHGEKFETVFLNWFAGWHRPETRTWNLRPLLAQIKCPTLVVQGADDEHATPRHARDIAAGIGASALWMAPKAAHMLPQEQPTLFNTKILEFLYQSIAG